MSRDDRPSYRARSPAVAPPRAEASEDPDQGRRRSSRRARRDEPSRSRSRSRSKSRGRDEREREKVKDDVVGERRRRKRRYGDEHEEDGEEQRRRSGSGKGEDDDDAGRKKRRRERERREEEDDDERKPALELDDRHQDRRRSPRERSPRRWRDDPADTFGPDDRRTSTNQRGGPPLPFFQPLRRTRSNSPSTEPLFKFRFILPASELISFLIGQGGRQQRELMAYSGLLRLSFSPNSEYNAPIGELVGSRHAIEDGLDAIKGVVERELGSPRMTDAVRAKIGDPAVWTSFGEEFLEDLGKTKGDWGNERRAARDEWGADRRGATRVSGERRESVGERGSGPRADKGAKPTWHPIESGPGTTQQNHDSQGTQRTHDSPRDGPPSQSNGRHEDQSNGRRDDGPWPPPPRQEQQNGRGGRWDDFSPGGPGSAPNQFRRDGGGPNGGGHFQQHGGFASNGPSPQDNWRGPPDLSFLIPKVAEAIVLGPGGGTIRGISAKTEAHCFLARHTYEPCLHAWGTPRQLDGVVIEVEMVVGDRVPGWRGPTRDMTGTGDGRGTGSRRDPGGWDEGRHEGRNEGGRNEGRDDDHGRHYNQGRFRDPSQDRMTLAPPVAANPARSTSTSNENLSPTSPNAVTHSNPSPPPSSPGEHSSPTRTTPEPERPVEATALAKPFLAALREMSRDEQNAMIRLITRELGLEVGREASVALGFGEDENENENEEDLNAPGPSKPQLSLSHALAAPQVPSRTGSVSQPPGPPNAVSPAKSLNSQKPAFDVTVQMTFGGDDDPEEGEEDMDLDNSSVLGEDEGGVKALESMKPYPAQPQTEVVPQSNGFLIRVRIPNLRKRDFKAGAGIVIKAAAGNA